LLHYSVGSLLSTFSVHALVQLPLKVRELEVREEGSQWLKTIAA
jgi:hypothetical protein